MPDDLKVEAHRSLKNYSLRRRSFARNGSHVLLFLACILALGCRSTIGSRKPIIQITRAPVADPGGPAQLDYIEGRVTNAAPGQQVVLYAHSGVWWIQPMRMQPFTKIQADSSWKNSTHLGTEYAALLVEANYQPPAKLTALPPEGGGVAAIATTSGKAGAPIVAKTIHFSGYDWAVRTAGSDRGGEANPFDPANAWTDDKGYLHLRVTPRDGKWFCAEINMTRSLGYGSYRFVVQDSAHLDASVVLAMFTWDETGTDETRSEMDIELSRWGNPDGKNAQYVVQPFYVPENVARFRVPSGKLTHSFRWEPGSAAFKTTAGAQEQAASKPINEHTFTLGIPNASAETVHIDLYEFHHAKDMAQQPAEVVIEKFEYLP